MKILVLVFVFFFTDSAFTFECRVLPHHMLSKNKQVEDSTMPVKEVLTSGECIEYAESLIGTDLKTKESTKASAVDFIIQKKTTTIRGTVITPKMHFKN